MLKYTLGLALFALIGTGLCGFVASKAHAYSCNTYCYTLGGQQFCNTSCY